MRGSEQPGALGRGKRRPPLRQLEEPFWEALHEIARSRGLRTMELVAELKGRVLGNPTPFVRRYVLDWYRSKAGATAQRAHGARPPAGPKLCRVCDTPIPAGRRRGAEREFCSSAHRDAWWSASRRFVAAGVASGRF